MNELSKYSNNSEKRIYSLNQRNAVLMQQKLNT